jgi:hypothetical protein
MRNTSTYRAARKAIAKATGTDLVPFNADRRTRAEQQTASTIPTTPIKRELGPYLVPLHLNGEAIKELEPSERDIAALRYQHYISMMQRNPMGFRMDRGTGSKRKRPHNVRRNGQVVASDLAMILNGLKFVARYGNEAPGSAFQ